MGTATIPVDLFNPGQVFACIGLAEATLVLTGNARGGFEGVGPRVEFTLEGDGPDSPVASVLEFLAQATVVSVAPERASDLSTVKWGVPTERISDDRPFPFPVPDSPATLPAVLRTEHAEIVLCHWGDKTRRDNVKFWAGAGGMPGAALLRDALDLVRPELPNAAADPFAVGAAQSSSFRFDWRRDYVPLGIGFSPNKHGSKLTPLGYPLVEILAAIGLSHARPNRQKKLIYRYCVPMAPSLPLPLIRAVLGGSLLPFPMRSFRMNLDWPGQKDQARCITDVVEESQS